MELVIIRPLWQPTDSLLKCQMAVSSYKVVICSLSVQKKIFITTDKVNAAKEMLNAWTPYKFIIYFRPELSS